jgi:crotonobetaine/carnitine-CoA ligase
MDHCVKVVPRFALPRYIEVVESLPRNATGRVQKFRLREDWNTAATWDRDAEGYVVLR